ncbi:RNA polymerase sigma factor [Verrucomicrobium spinosum]|uniref:RNA polymerase sigma factor n=1 Tax=Verrucomicrobium spinosum TaxID=2736 RepID=UPI0009464FB2|nr:sigma factor [Verrucomicrobium spinosum]
MSEIKWIAMLTPCPDAALPRGFHTTRWSVIRQAIADDDKQSREALEQICRAYWYPLYAFVRRSGHSREDSQDLVQGFFLKLLNKHLLGVANPDKGKLRTFLLTCLRRYLLDERDRAMAQKREGNRGVSSSLALDTDWAEQRYAEEPVDHLTPDRLFQRRWALTVLELTCNCWVRSMSAGTNVSFL